MAGIRQVLKGNVLVLTIGTVIRQLSLFITFPYFSLYIRSLGGSNVAVGYVNAIRPLASLFVFPIAGALADSYSRVKTVVIMDYVNAVLFLIFMFAPDWRFLVAANFLNGILVFQYPASSALLADSMPSHLRGRGFGAVNAIPGLMGIVSPFIGGYIITALGIVSGMRLLYGITVAAVVIIGTMNWRLLKETLSDSVRSEMNMRNTIKNSYSSLWQTFKWMPRNLRVYAIILVLCFFFNSVSGPYWVLFGKDVIRLSELEWGTLLLVANIFQFSLSLPAGVLLDKYGKRKIFSLALAFSVVPVIAFRLSKGFFSTLLILICIAVSNAFLFPAANVLMAEMVPHERRGRVMAVMGRGMLGVNFQGGGGGGPAMGFLLTFPTIIGFLVGGYIYDVGPAYPWLLLGTALGFSALLSLFLTAGRKSNLKP